MKQTLKLLLTGLILSGSPALLKAQVPQKFNYQGIARDSKGNPMGKQTLGIKLSVLPTADATTPEYEEVQTITTNEFGLYTLQIGNGTAVTGTMKEVKWETGNKYIKVAIDPQGGTNYADAGTTQLLSVPYAIYADKAGMAKETAGGDRAGAVSTSAAGTGTVNFLTKFTAANTIYNSQVFDNGTNIGIGTTTPAATAKIHINQNSASVLEHMRMQNLSATGAGRFTLYSDGASNYSTFTKYGSTYAGGYAGITTLYPYANLLAFGNNGLVSGDGLGRFLISTAGNAGISLFKGGTSKLKFHADFTTENVGIGGNSAPVSRVHMNNTDGTNMDLRLTNTSSGHTASDGLVVAEQGGNAVIRNQENDYMDIGTNGATNITIAPSGAVGIGTVVPSTRLDVRSPGFYTARFRNSGSNADKTAVIGFESGDASPSTWLQGVSGAGNGISVIQGGYYLENAGKGVRMMIDTFGNMGIGKANANDGKLDINNTISQRSLNVISNQTNAQMVNLEMTTAPNSAQDILQLSVPVGSPDGFQFIECDRGGVNSFAVNGNGSVEFSGALQPGGSSGTSGQILQSAGSAAAPAWVNGKSVPGATAMAGNFYGFSGSSLPAAASTYTLFGPTQTVTLTANQRVVMCITASLGKSAAGTSGFRLDVGYRANTGTTVTNASGTSYLNQNPSIGAGTRNVYTMAGSIKPGAGTWVIGAVVYGPANYFDNNDYVNGYYMIINE